MSLGHTVLLQHLQKLEKKTKKHQKPLLFTRVTHISFVCDFSRCFFVLCSVNIPLRLSHLIADSITSSKLQACRQAVPLWCRSIYVLCDLYLCPLLGELSGERMSRKMAPTLLIWFFSLSFFRWNKPGCRRPSSAESLLRPLCQINFMLLLPKQP